MVAGKEKILDEEWFKKAVFYAVDIETFYDSNGDGIGDIEGLIQKLEYIEYLGVNAIWLLPFYPTPNRDNGYDVVDYMQVDSRLGTLDDFARLIKKASERNIRIVLDLVMHHTSDEHPWFKEARHNKDSRFHNYYIWNDNPPKSNPKDIMFPGAEDSVWKYDEVADSSYHHTFYHFQPDLNFTSADVQEEFVRIMDFWLSFGIAGFRIDAAAHLFRLEHTQPFNEELAKSFSDRMHEVLTNYQDNGVLIGESDVSREELKTFWGDGDRFNMLFNFLLNNELFLSLAEKNARAIKAGIGEMKNIPRGCQWLNFARNLDELDLDQLNEEQREIVYKAFAPEENMRIYNRGIRRRLTPMLSNDKSCLKMVQSLLFSFPGSAILVYGDEIGMGENLSLNERESVRLPMQWNSSENGGFSTAKEGYLIERIPKSGEYVVDKVNVENSSNDHNSVLNFTRKLVNLRKDNDILSFGEWEILEGLDESLMGIVYRKDGKELSIINNLSNSKVEINLGEILAGNSEIQLSDSDYVHTDNNINPYGYLWAYRSI